MMCLVSVHNDQGMSILTLTLGHTFQFLFSNPDGIECLLYSISLRVRPRGGRTVNHLFFKQSLKAISAFFILLNNLNSLINLL
jgi:hypothetical protein